MKFKVGHFYKTRNGEKVVYIGENALSHWRHKLFGNENTFWTVDDDGFHVCSKCESSLDIIGEWTGEVTLWVAYKNQFDKLWCETEELANTARERGYQVQQVTFKG